MEKIEETEMCIICVRRHSVDLTRINYCKSVSHANYRNKFLKADSAAHEALQIFQTDKHPSHIGIGIAKEG
ncbi:hypothetical protein Hanom_Chr03g00246671 [Helianthus anomalus]